MSVHEPSMNDHESLPVPAEPVLDGELVDEPPQAHYYSPQLGWFTSWWLRSPRVPVWLKSRQHAVQALKDLAVALVRAPDRYVFAVVRGLIAGARLWRQWVTVRDFREAAELSEKLADKFVEIRALTLFRWKVTGAVLVAAVIGLALVDLVWGRQWFWLTIAAVSVALAVLGRRRDGAPGRKAVLAGPRTLTWTMDPQVLVDAFRDAKLIGKDETLRLVERATRVGDGWAITVDLPATRKAADVIKNRESLASALAVDEVQLIVERVRGNGGHPGRV
jgi:DNA segregation ATPase FtsK/SpoIIIE, S-DNA-T family